MADDDDETRLVHKLPTTACDTFKWWHFCDLLETVLAIAEDQAADKPAKNAKTRAAVFAPWTRAARLRGESLYPYLRLLIPTEDVRPKYKLKEKRIAEAYVERLAIAKDHPDAWRLINWKNPEAASNKHNSRRKAGETVAVAQNDFAQVAYGVVAERAGAERVALLPRPRHMERVHSEWTLKDVNDWLDELAGADEKGSAKAAVFARAIAQLSPKEQKWLLREVLKDMRVGLSTTRVLSWYHPSAVEKFNVCASLEAVAAEPSLRDPDARPPPFSIHLGVPFKPLLAERMTWNWSGAKLESGWADFFVERKLDGERALIHWCRSGKWPKQETNGSGSGGADAQASSSSAAAAGGGTGADAGAGKKKGGKKGAGAGSSSSEPTWRVRIWGRDSSTSMRAHFQAALGPYVAEALGGLEEAILDGEMMGWDAKEGAFLPLGQSKMAAQYMVDDPEWATGEGGKHLCFMAFDLLWARGWPGHAECDGALVDRPLAVRRKLLEAAVLKRETYFEVLPASRVMARHAEAVAAEFTAAIDRGDEGLIIKKAGSTYALTSRHNRTKDWLKLKPEYATEGSTDLDCAIVAAYRGTGARRTELKEFSHFLLAVRSDDGELDADGELVPNKMLTFAKVGTGYDYKQLEDMNKKLKPLLQKVDRGTKKLPEYLRDWKPATTDDIPDAVVGAAHLKNTLIITVKGSELNPSGTFSSGLALRFPRLTMVRNDKVIGDILSRSQLSELARANNGKLARPPPSKGGDGGDDGDQFAEELRGARGRRGRGTRSRAGGKPAGAGGGGRRSTGGAILEMFRYTDVSDVEVDWDIFRDLKAAVAIAAGVDGADEIDVEGMPADDTDAARAALAKVPWEVYVAAQAYDAMPWGPPPVAAGAGAGASGDGSAAAVHAEGGGDGAASDGGGSAGDDYAAAVVSPSVGAAASSSAAAPLPSLAPSALQPSSSAPPAPASAAASDDGTVAGVLHAPGRDNAAADRLRSQRWIPPEFRSRSALDKLVKSLGGKPVANRSESTKVVVAAGLDLLVSWAIAKEDMDVVHPCWLLECMQAEGRVRFEPRHLLHASAETRAAMEAYVDVATGDVHGQAPATDVDAARALVRSASVLTSAGQPRTDAASGLLVPQPATAAESGASAVRSAAAAASSAPASLWGARLTLAESRRLLDDAAARLSASKDADDDALELLSLPGLALFREHPPVWAAAVPRQLAAGGASDESSSCDDASEGGGDGAAAGRKRLRRGGGNAKATKDSGRGGGGKPKAAAVTPPPPPPPPRFTRSGCVAFFDRYAVVPTSTAVVPQALPHAGPLPLAEGQFLMHRGVVQGALDAAVNVVVADEARPERLVLIHSRLAALQPRAVAAPPPAKAKAARAGGKGGRRARGGGADSPARGIGRKRQRQRVARSDDDEEEDGHASVEADVDDDDEAPLDGSQQEEDLRMMMESDNSDGASQTGTSSSAAASSSLAAAAAVPPRSTVPVVSYRWVRDSIAAGRQLPVDEYVLLPPPPA